MDNELTFRDIEHGDLEFVKQVCNYYVLNSTVTFHTNPLSIEELKDMLPINDKRYKSYIINHWGNKCGSCYFSPYSKRQGYDRTTEISIYLHPNETGKGIGEKIVHFMIEIAKKENFKNIVACIAGENAQSIRLFSKCGFEKCAHIKNIGEKFNRLIDDYIYQKEIN